MDPDGFTPIYTCNVFETCDVIQFHKDARRAYIQTNQGDLDLMTLALLDPATGQIETVESDPLGASISESAWFSEATDELVETQYSDDRDRRYFKDPGFEADYRWLEEKFPGKEISVDLQHPRRAPVADQLRMATPSPAKRTSSTAKRATSRFNTKFAKNCRASRLRRCRRSATNLPTAWRFPRT